MNEWICFNLIGAVDLVKNEPERLQLCKKNGCHWAGGGATR
jgi:hypothetical protein